MDTSLRILLCVLASGFIGVAALIIYKQHKATTCELHNRRVARVAMVLCILSSLLGLALMIIAALA
ncbi:MAG: hypothetical protein ABGZ35_31775 [Planctomycetaceae bacterium]|jgi:hypothetical protein